MRDVSIEEWTAQERWDAEWAATEAAQTCVDELGMNPDRRWLWMMVPGMNGSPVVLVMPFGQTEYAH